MKKIISILLAFVMLCSITPFAFAASDEAIEAANDLYELGLFKGVSTNSDGAPDFDLDRAPTRHEGVTMLVRLLGKEDEARAGAWEIPFTDVVEWAKPYIGYAYTNGLTKGTSSTTFGGESTITASEYITLVLRALGYKSGTDFQWDRAWELSDKIGLTDGRYNASTIDFLRGDVAIISNNALSTKLKSGEKTLMDTLNQSTIVTPENLQGIWQAQEIISRGFYREYVFSGNNFTFVYSLGLPDDSKTLIYQKGTYQIVENEIVFTYTQDTFTSSTGFSSKEGTESWKISEYSGDSIKFDGVNYKYDKVAASKSITNEIVNALTEKANDHTPSSTQRAQIANKLVSAANNVSDGLEASLEAGSYNILKMSATGTTYQKYNLAEKSSLRIAANYYSQAKVDISDIKNIANQIGNVEIVSRCNRSIELLDQLLTIEEMDTPALQMCSSHAKELVALFNEIAELAGTKK